MNDACVVLCTAPDSAVAESIADRLVTEKLAACLAAFGRWPKSFGIIVWLSP